MSIPERRKGWKLPEKGRVLAADMVYYFKYVQSQENQLEGTSHETASGI